MTRVLLLLALLFVAGPVQARRVAMLIANQEYRAEARLANPVRDAEMIARALGSGALGFDTVVVRRDLDAVGLRRALAEFSDLASGADSAILYYSGHAVRDDRNHNMLLPVDAVIQQKSDVRAYGIDSEEIVQAMQAAAPRVGLIVLDACRNNPFLAALGGKGSNKGLARRGVDDLNRLLIAYAAQAGSTADDGPPGRGSPFGNAFARHVAVPGQGILEMLDLVADDVAADTSNRQRPMREGDLRVADVLMPARPTVVPPRRPPVVPDRPAPTTPGPFLVFFDWDSVAITVEAASVLDRVIDQYRAYKQAMGPAASIGLQLAGHTDRTGTRDHAIEISALRAAAVREYLRSHGIALADVLAEAAGDLRPLVNTPPGVREPQNRRVEITVGVKRAR